MSGGKRWTGIAAILLFGCSGREAKPVDIFPEDVCSNCRMAISDAAFACEVVVTDGDALKFDSSVCLESYRKKHPDAAGTIFYADYETHAWLRANECVLVRTSIETPMGPGAIAVRTQERADALLKQFPENERPTR